MGAEDLDQAFAALSLNHGTHGTGKTTVTVLLTETKDTRPFQDTCKVYLAMWLMQALGLRAGSSIILQFTLLLSLRLSQRCSIQREL